VRIGSFELRADARVIVIKFRHSVPRSARTGAAPASLTNMRQVPMAKDKPTYSEAVRAAAAEAAAALGTKPEAVRPRAIGARRRPGNDGKASVLLDVDAEKDKARRKRPDMQPVDHLVVRGEQRLGDGEARVSLAFFRLMTNSTCERLQEGRWAFRIWRGSKRKSPGVNRGFDRWVNALDRVMISRAIPEGVFLGANDSRLSR
jgi:hypothetical protein